MDRRDFILKGGLSLVAVTFLGKGAYGFAPALQTAGACLPTTADILGPFYRANAPFRTSLSSAGDPGSPLLFQGQVLSEDCSPIPGALVDVWQANNTGAYDNNTSAFRYRGRQTAASDGSYSFSSVEPGWYLNGNQYRPRHIHFRVTAPGYTELITQLYFENDPYIPIDPWASVPAAEHRIVPIADVNGVPTAQFQIYLQSNATGIEDLGLEVPVKARQNPFRHELSLQSSREPLLNCELFNALGVLVARQYDINQHEMQLQLGHLASGLYFARLQTQKSIYVLQVVKE